MGRRMVVAVLLLSSTGCEDLPFVGSGRAVGSDDVTGALGGEAISINNGSMAAMNSRVLLSFSGVMGATQVRVANEVDPLSSPWLNYPGATHSMGHTLANQDGMRTVKVQFKYGHAPDAPVSVIKSDNILLDRSKPTGGVVINEGARSTTGRVVTLTLSAQDSGTGVRSYQVSHDGAWPTDASSWLPFVSEAEHDLGGTQGHLVVQVRYRDGAGNISDAVSDDITVDTVPPTATLTIVAPDNSNSVDYTRSLAVQLLLSADHPASALSMRVTNDPGIWPDAFVSFAATKDHTLAAGDGTKTVYVEVRDTAGNSVIVSDSITLDTVPPTGHVMINDGSSGVASAQVTLELVADDASGVQYYQVANEGEVWPATWLPFDQSPMFVPHALSAGNGDKTVLFRFVDRANLQTTVSAGVALRVPRTLALVRGDQDATTFQEVVNFFKERNDPELDFLAPYNNYPSQESSIAQIPGFRFKWINCEGQNPGASNTDCDWGAARIAELQQAGTIPGVAFNVECYPPGAPVTNPVECEDYVGVVQRMSQLSHDAGLQFLVAPAYGSLMQHAAALAPHVDVMVLQIPHTVTNYAQKVADTTSILRANNPDIVVIVQLISRVVCADDPTNTKCNGPASEILGPWNSVKDLVDGVQVFFYLEPSPLSLLTDFYNAVRPMTP